MSTPAHSAPSQYQFAPGSLSFRLLSFPAVLTGVVAVCVFLLSARSMADPDIGWHLRNAEYQLQSAHFIRHDMFAFTTIGAPWINHEWLAEIPFYLGWQTLGERGLYVVTLLALEAIFLGVYLLAYRMSNNAKASCLVTVAATYLGTVSFGPRTLLFGWIALIAELLILERYTSSRFDPTIDRRRAIRNIWFLPLLFMVWVNTHGSWLIGINLLLLFIAAGSFNISQAAVQGTAWTSRERRQWLIIFSLCILALFLNPYGWRLVFYPFDLAFKQKLNIASIVEWRSLDMRALRSRIFLGTLAVTFFTQLFRRRVWSPWQIALLCVGIYSAFSYSRFLFLGAILIMPLIAVDLAGWRRSASQPDRPLLNALLLGAMVFVGIYTYIVRLPAINQDSESEYPLKALPYLANFHPAGRVLNDYEWGGFLEWHARYLPTFIDSRVDIFERSGVLADYLDIINVKNSLALLDKYDIHYVLFAQGQPLVYLLRQSPRWKIDYQDATTILLERTALAEATDAAR